MSVVIVFYNVVHGVIILRGAILLSWSDWPRWLEESWLRNLELRLCIYLLAHILFRVVGLFGGDCPLSKSAFAGRRYETVTGNMPCRIAPWLKEADSRCTGKEMTQVSGLVT